MLGRPTGNHIPVVCLPNYEPAPDLPASAGSVIGYGVFNGNGFETRHLRDNRVNGSGKERQKGRCNANQDHADSSSFFYRANVSWTGASITYVTS